MAQTTLPRNCCLVFANFNDDFSKQWRLGVSTFMHQSLYLFYWTKTIVFAQLWYVIPLGSSHKLLSWCFFCVFSVKFTVGGSVWHSRSCAVLRRWYASVIYWCDWWIRSSATERLRVVLEKASRREKTRTGCWRQWQRSVMSFNEKTKVCKIVKKIKVHKNMLDVNFHVWCDADQGSLVCLTNWIWTVQCIRILCTVYTVFIVYKSTYCIYKSSVAQLQLLIVQLPECC